MLLLLDEWYLGDDSELHDLAICTVIAISMDKNLQSDQMGDVIPKPDAKMTKMDKVLDRQDSRVTKCLAEMLHVMRSWAFPDARRKPLCILEAVNAPFHDQDFAHRARGNIFRAHSAVDRRFALLLSSLPSCLKILYSEHHTDKEKNEFAEWLLNCPRRRLDSFSYGFQWNDHRLSISCFG